MWRSYNQRRELLLTASQSWAVKELSMQYTVRKAVGEHSDNTTDPAQLSSYRHALHGVLWRIYRDNFLLSCIFCVFFLFLFKGSSKCGFPPCCAVQVLPFARCASFVVLSEQIKMMMISGEPESHADRGCERLQRPWRGGDAKPNLQTRAHDGDADVVVSCDSGRCCQISVEADATAERTEASLIRRRSLHQSIFTSRGARRYWPDMWSANSVCCVASYREGWMCCIVLVRFLDQYHCVNDNSSTLTCFSHGVEISLWLQGNAALSAYAAWKRNYW